MRGNRKKELWIEMSIREIWTQSHFAELAYKNINLNLDSPDAVFSSIHSFLSHCVMVSKMLKARGESNEVNLIRFLKEIIKRLRFIKGEITGEPIGSILEVSENSVVHKRKFRNHLEHYDERLKEWIGRLAEGAIIGTYNIGPKSAIKADNIVFVNHYNPSNKTFTFVDRDLNLEELFNEVSRIKKLADSWVGSLNQPRDVKETI